MIDVLAAKAALSTGWGLFKRFWWIIPAVVAVVWILALKADVRHLEKKLERANEKAGELTMGLNVTTASLDEATRHLNDQNRRVMERNRMLEQARRDAAASEARAKERWKSTAATIAELEEASRRPNRAPCTLSPEARRALEGL